MARGKQLAMPALQPVQPTRLMADLSPPAAVLGVQRQPLQTKKPCCCRRCCSAHFCPPRPTGQNPTGAVMDAARMGEVYALARKWSLVIIEDDAYYWLQYPQGPDNVPGLNLRRELCSARSARLSCHSWCCTTACVLQGTTCLHTQLSRSGRHACVHHRRLS